MPSRLPRLTSLRAVAALYVFAFHISADGHLTLRGIFVDGYTGVAFFFVLSGFVLTWAWQPGSSPKSFFRNRFARIYPSYLLMLGVAAVYPGTKIHLSVGKIVASLFLVQSWSGVKGYDFVGDPVSWTLSCEALFYALFPLAVQAMRGSRPRRWIIAAGYWLACSWFVTGPVEMRYPLVQMLPPARLGEFLLGIAAALDLRAGLLPHIPVPAAWILLLVGAAVCNPMQSNLPSVILTLGYLLVIIASAQADVAGKTGLLTGSVATYLGTISFAFYLVHELLIYQVTRYLGHHETVTIVTLLELSVISAMLLHHLVEHPLDRILRGDRLQRRTQPSAQQGPKPVGRAASDPRSQRNRLKKSTHGA